MTAFVFQKVIFCILFIKVLGLRKPCQARSFGGESVVCVCNENYCDNLLLLHVPEPVFYESNKDGARFEPHKLNFTYNPTPGAPIFSLDHDVRYQDIYGFGGAFTDSACMNMDSLSPKVKIKLLKTYFSKIGLEYNLGRVPMASTDFSSHEYSYADVKGDFNLTHFSLTNEDRLYKIPYIKAAKILSRNKLLLIGSPWSSPAWMKTNGHMKGKGSLFGKPGGPYYKTWADYFVKFLQAYEHYNITFWGLTIQNEPLFGCQDFYPLQAICFTPEKQRDFLKFDLGPALQKAGFPPEKLKLMILDDAKGLLPKYADIIMNDKEAAQYVSGIAFHWYFGKFMDVELLDITHARHPDLFLLATEACTGSYPWDHPKVDLGSWERAEDYAYDIIQDLLNWASGWIDWNLALNLEGGPSFVNNYVDSPIIVNTTGNEFYKQPMYYVLAHFSKVLPRGSYRIGLYGPESNLDENNPDIAAFKTPDAKTVVIVLNRSEEDMQIALFDKHRGFLNVQIRAHAIQSHVW